jgi:HEPN domain-containing protein
MKVASCMSARDPEVLAVARDWLRKADGDLEAARLLLVGGGPAWIVSFHAQQAVEKYVKALLVLNGVRVGRTHDIGELLASLPPLQRPALDPEITSELTSAAVASRYPEAEESSVEDAQRLVQHARNVRAFVHTLIPRDLLQP